jgi:serine/threonine protein kinase
MEPEKDEITKEDLENVYDLNDSYTILLDYKLGSGAFGQIYKCLNKKTNKLYAAKIESYDTQNPQLQKESKIINEMKGSFGFPYLYEVINKTQDLIIIIDLLGPNLEDIMYNLPGRKFSIKTALMISNQILQRLKDLHEKGFIHRDIKPENFVIGRKPKERIIYMIDFGLSRRYINEKNKNHISLKNERGILGTLRYISMNCHEGLEVSRRDDLESLFYIIIYFFTGNLPWIGIRCKNKEEKYKKVYEKKKKSVPNEICKDLPEEFKMFISYVLDLDFMDKPNYNYLNGLVDRLFTKFGCSKDDINFDWYNEEFLKKLYDTCARNNNNTSENNNNINDNNINNNKNNNKENKGISGKNSNIKKNNVRKKSNLNNVKININAFKTPPIKTKNKDNLFDNIPIYKKNKFEGRKINGRHYSNIPISKKKLFEYKEGKRNISNLHEQKTANPKMKKKI